ncbi:GDP-fucose protein O-fucosyltransferase [Vigna unguiculata]|uniref:O-fucosyltransferase family protein n=1 Tax=Vigna unguiculata TaxID=3917 RepID=A0A4D6KIZ7_VIGUN|nr:GDP-fucose protein O-fucosyltransferase [Vigna unguiculata]
MEVLSKFSIGIMNSVTSKCMILFVTVLILRALLFPSFPGFEGIEWSNLVHIRTPLLNFDFGIRQDKFLVAPQIVWGLNNQKIAFARACLTARMLNRTLLMPSLSASLFYKEVDLLQPISFDKIFQFEKFNTLCHGFVRLGRYSDVLNRTQVLEMEKGSGRRWTMEKDLSQLKKHGKGSFDDHEVIRIVGKNPFLWHDHWPVKDYARIFECLYLTEEIAKEVDRVVSRIRAVEGKITGNTEAVEMQNNITNDGPYFEPLPYVAVHMRIEIDWMIHCKNLERRLNTNQICSGKKEIVERVRNIAGLKTPVVVYLAVADKLLNNSSILDDWEEGIRAVEGKITGNTEAVEMQNNITNDGPYFEPLPYVAVHMRIEIDWMIHCKNLERRLNTNQICSGKKEIVERVRNIAGLKTPVVVYLAVADKLLNNSSILDDWEEGFVPFEKKKLGVDGIYKKYPYLIQSAIDYEVCLRADTFVGNSFSTFSSLIVLERTQKMIRMNGTNLCGENVRWPSYAYNIPGTSNGPKRWVTNMSESNLQSISYGTNHISC